MSKPDIQFFAEDGTWVKPPGAVRADVVLQAGGGGAVTGAGPVCVGRGPDGELTVHAIPADDLPDVMPVLIGKAGRPDGRDGFALILTHLTGEGERRAADTATIPHSDLSVLLAAAAALGKDPATVPSLLQPLVDEVVSRYKVKLEMTPP